MILNILLILLILLLITKIYINYSKENYVNCNRYSCNIDTYNIKYPNGFEIENNYGNYKDKSHLCDNLDTKEDKIKIKSFYKNYFDFYNMINNNSSQRYDTVDKINYDINYPSKNVWDVYNYLTKN